jgi:hypothetical protein
MRVLVLVAFALTACSPSGETKSAPAEETSATPSGAWDSELLTLLPEIDACIEAVPHARTVTYAKANGDGTTLVRLRGGEARIDCRVDADNVSIRPRDDALQVAGEDDAIFVRGPGENPGGECYQAPEVRDAAGQVIGWMLDPEGC